jgi:hypothetical protein
MTPELACEIIGTTRQLMGTGLNGQRLPVGGLGIVGHVVVETAGAASWIVLRTGDGDVICDYALTDPWSDETAGLS